eukprot:2536232-Rhodomonas_salina.1
MRMLWQVRAMGPDCMLGLNRSEYDGVIIFPGVEIQVGLSKTGAKIDAVERGIQAAEEKAEAAAAEGNREERDYWREEKKQLREKEKQLREKEQQLLEKELVLLKWSGGMVHQQAFFHT